MASVSATHLIMFIASLVLAVGIAGTVVVEVDSLSTAIEDRGTTVADDVATEIEIISDEGANEAIYETESDEVVELTVLVKNVGSTDLPVEGQTVDVVVDGNYISNDRITSIERVDVPGNSTWRPGGVVELALDVSSLAVDGDTEIAVMVDGNEDAIDVHVAGGG